MVSRSCTCIIYAIFGVFLSKHIGNKRKDKKPPASGLVWLQTCKLNYEQACFLILKMLHKVWCAIADIQTRYRQIWLNINFFELVS